jgi:putative transposase
VKYAEFVKSLFNEISLKSNFCIETIEVDEDHIHCLVKSEPKISPLSIIRKLKQESTFNLWRKFDTELKKNFWKERTFWSDGYFCCTIGNASEEVIRKYIESQG